VGTVCDANLHRFLSIALLSGSGSLGLAFGWLKTIRLINEKK